MRITFVFCFIIIAMLAMNPKALKSGDIPAKTEFIITLSWPDMNPNDIDLWLQDPGGNLLRFRARAASLIHLNRDDRSPANDSIVVNGKSIINPLNQEVVTLRGVAPGEYTVNAHCCDSKDGKPAEVAVSILEVIPRAEVTFYGAMTLARKGDEATAARFTVLPGGSVANINTLPKTPVQRI